MAYEYRFTDPSVARIASSVQEIACETAPIFYALKTISKTHWRGHDTPEMCFAQKAVESNAEIYLTLMESLGHAALSEAAPNCARRCCERARAEILTLINGVEEQVQLGIFAARSDDETTLLRHLQAFQKVHLESYERAASESAQESHMHFSKRFIRPPHIGDHPSICRSL